MKAFGGPVLFLDRNDINTDEIIPAKYLTEISKQALKPHLLEDLLIDKENFDNNTPQVQDARVVVTRANFGCGSSREHAVWAFEVNHFNVIIAESFARIFRQNMFNCGILAVELKAAQIESLFQFQGSVSVEIDLDKLKLSATSDHPSESPLEYDIQINSFDRELVSAGGWLSYAAARY